jgi:ADP-heptose:LPS heptosyltransferase
VVVQPSLHHAELPLVLANAARLSESAIEIPALGTPVLEPTAADHRAAAAALARYPAVGRKPVVIHPGTGWPVKNWPPERWGTVAGVLASHTGSLVLVTGTAPERSTMESVVAHAHGRAVALPESLSLGPFAALLSRARVVLGSDSGPLHLAALVGTPVIGLYGPYSVAEASPWTTRERYRALELGLPCAPCHRLEGPPCGATMSAPCISRIDVGPVVSAAVELLEQRVPRSA